MVDYWAENAACKGAEPGLFDADHLKSKKEMTRRETAAKEICGGCTVQYECLAWALDHDEENGIYGGYTPEERK